MALTDLAQRCIKTHFERTSDCLELAVDATCGNGHDTEFLCGMGFDLVVGFDVQPRAIEITRHRLQVAGLTNAQLHVESHEKVAETVSQPINCAMFNFGYLPHGDKRITTLADSSIRALRSVLSLLAPNGIVSLMCYPGHPTGQLETEAIRDFLTKLELEPKHKGGEWRVEHHQSAVPRASAPELFLLKLI